MSFPLGIALPSGFAVDVDRGNRSRWRERERGKLDELTLVCVPSEVTEPRERAYCVVELGRHDAGDVRDASPVRWVRQVENVEVVRL
jgi:hypothetical protein